MGFIGSRLADALKADGHEVFAFDSVAGRVKGGVKFIRGDLGTLSDVLDAVRLNNVQDIFHLGAVLSATAEDNPMATFGVNFMGTINVLEAARIFNVKKAIYTSSVASYGPGLPQPVVESSRQQPQSAYGISKVFSELWGLWYSRRYGIDFRVLRLPVVIGPGRGPGGASAFATLIVEKLALGEEYDIEVDEDARVPLIYYKDAVRALVALYDASVAPSRIYNVTAMSPSAGEIVNVAERFTHNHTARFKPKPDIVRIVDSWPQALDDSKARAELHWQPAFDLDSMVDDFVREVRTRSYGSKNRD